MANLQDAEKAFAPLFGMTVGEAHRIGRALQKGGNIRTGKPGGNVNARGVSITLRETATLFIALAAPGPRSPHWSGRISTARGPISSAPFAT